MTSGAFKIGRVTLNLSNLDKVLYPEKGFTKADVIHYYLTVAPALLPHVKGRALTLKRYPNGVDEEYFYEKRCPVHRPKWVKTADIVSSSGEKINFCVIDAAPALAWVANLASLELHTSLAKAVDPDRPTMMVFDLDPGPPAGMLDAGRVALKLRDLLADLGLKSFVKTSGGKGIHMAVPLNTAVSYDDTKSFSHALATTLEQQEPDSVVSKMSKALRKGKVFVDWSQNDRHKTTACVYSLRARARPTVSTPITWKELEAAVQKKSTSKLTFEAGDVLKRVASQGDLFASVEKIRQRLPRLSALSQSA